MTRTQSVKIQALLGSACIIVGLLGALVIIHQIVSIPYPGHTPRHLIGTLMIFLIIYGGGTIAILELPLRMLDDEWTKPEGEE